MFNSNIKTKDRDDFHEQWLYIKCEEGYNAFIQDKDLLNQHGIREGKIIQYGEIGF